MVGCARKQVGRAFQGGEWRQTLSEMPGPAFREAPRVYLAVPCENQDGKRSAGGSSSKADGLSRNQVPQTAAFFVLLAAHGFLSPLHTRSLLGLWEVSKMPDLFYLLHPSSVWRSLFMNTWPPPPMSLATAVFATEKSQCAPATSLFSCRGGCTIRLQMDDFSQRK